MSTPSHKRCTCSVSHHSCPHLLHPLLPGPQHAGVPRDPNVELGVRSAANGDFLQPSCQTCCCGFAWQGFGSGGATGVASVRSFWKLPPCQIKPMSAGSKMDLPLAKAEPISDSGNASVITYLRRGKTCCGTAVEREE